MNSLNHLAIIAARLMDLNNVAINTIDVINVSHSIHKLNPVKYNQLKCLLTPILELGYIDKTIHIFHRIIIELLQWKNYHRN